MASIAAKMEEEKREKERQLEELRQLVRVEAPSDPRRAMMDTEVCTYQYVIYCILHYTC